MRLFLFCALLLSTFAEEPSTTVDAKQTIAQKHEQERSLLSELTAIDQNLVALQKEMGELSKKKESISTEQKAQQLQLQTIGKEYTAVEKLLIEKTNLLYKIHRRGIARIIFGAENPVDLRRRSTYLKNLIKSDKDKLETFRQLARERKKVMDELDRNQKQLQMLETALKQKEQGLSQQRQEKSTFLENVQKEKKLAMQLLREMEVAQQNFQNQIVIQPDSTVSVSANSMQSNTVKSFSDLYGKLPWPIKGTLLRRFGKQKDPITGEVVVSNGIDIHGMAGQSVRAVADGVVALATFIPKYGQTVVINHERYSTVYAHLNGVSVTQGQLVSKGNTVGLVGNTGITDAQNSAWLTFEIRYNKTPQDPLSWLESSSK